MTIMWHGRGASECYDNHVACPIITVYQISMPSTLNTHNVICQINLNLKKRQSCHALLMKGRGVRIGCKFLA